MRTNLMTTLALTSVFFLFGFLGALSFGDTPQYPDSLITSTLCYRSTSMNVNCATFYNTTCSKTGVCIYCAGNWSANDVLICVGTEVTLGNMSCCDTTDGTTANCGAADSGNCDPKMGVCSDTGTVLSKKGCGSINVNCNGTITTKNCVN